MATDGLPEGQPPALEIDDKAHERGRLGLTASWSSIPWWGVIILIVGIIVGYSVFTNETYLDAISFIFDLPWNKEMLAKNQLDDDGAWEMTIKPPLKTGRTYRFYAEYQDELGNEVGRSEYYVVEIPKDAPEGKTTPITEPSETAVVSDTSTPTIAGVAEGGKSVLLWDDFSGKPLRIANRMWTAKGFFMTIRVTLIAFVVAMILGLAFGVMRVADRSPDLSINLGRRLLFGIPLILLVLIAVPDWRTPLSIGLVVFGVEAFMFLLPVMPYTISTLYVEIVRGVPMLVIILYMGFAVTPMVREATSIDLRGLPAAIIGLAFGYGAYLAEVYRAGIESIPKGQMEAARSLGMSYFSAMRYVILPQAIRVVLPPLGNDFIALLKDSALISVIALPEVLQQGRLWISRNFRAFEGFNTVALTYLVMTLLLSLLVRYIERKTRLPGR